ncbi:trypsin-like serine peptidase [Enhygromyxa salina]|uniref:Uncharacterized protein n=1 Tax=Enhygromyxa salina TaxID=215803 RepID=A0A2S9XPD3_9BACT|nr:hypothetical protein [Enhygromyxa salina]PRP94600.1 hypothetical protein ENSA7_77690 [Enhygromyxa salina]
MGPQEVESDEETLVQEHVWRAWERRTEYEASGIEPEVPVDLGRDIGSENLEFVGFADIGTELGGLPDGSPDDTTCEDNLEALGSLAENAVWGYFINPAGETWRWRPRDPVASFTTVRRANREAFIERAVREVVPSVRGADEGVHGEDDAGDDVFRGDGVLGADNRVIRSASSGHSMTSIKGSWVRIGGLPNEGWDPGSNGDNTAGTATKIGPRHLLTVGHGVWKGGHFFPKDWWPGEDGVAHETELTNSAAPNGVKKIDWYYIAPKWYESEKNTQDFAILILHDNASSAQFPSFGFKEDYALAQELTWNFGIPSPGKSCAGSPLVGDSCRSSLYGHKKPVRRTEASYVFTAHDAQPEHSGGPVYKFDGGDRNIVAIVKSKYSAVENRHLRIWGFVFDTIVAVMNAHPSSHCVDYGWTSPGCD